MAEGIYFRCCDGHQIKVVAFHETVACLFSDTQHNNQNRPLYSLLKLRIAKTVKVQRQPGVKKHNTVVAT